MLGRAGDPALHVLELLGDLVHHDIIPALQLRAERLLLQRRAVFFQLVELRHRVAGAADGAQPCDEKMITVAAKTMMMATASMFQPGRYAAGGARQVDRTGPVG